MRGNGRRAHPDAFLCVYFEKFVISPVLPWEKGQRAGASDWIEALKIAGSSDASHSCFHLPLRPYALEPLAFSVLNRDALSILDSERLPSALIVVHVNW